MAIFLFFCGEFTKHILNYAHLMSIGIEYSRMLSEKLVRVMSMETIRAREVANYIGKECTIIIDLRRSDEYYRGHIESAVNIPFEEIENQFSILDRYDTIILYCDRGNKSLLTAKNLMKKGFNVISLGGGFRAYSGKLAKNR